MSEVHRRRPSITPRAGAGAQYLGDSRVAQILSNLSHRKLMLRKINASLAPFLFAAESL
jgi:hypothetical protein